MFQKQPNAYTQSIGQIKLILVWIEEIKYFLYLRIVDIMLIISVIAVRLHADLNFVFYGSFTPRST